MMGDVEAALSGVRELVAADGGDIEVVGFAAGEASLRLILEGAECRECVMPRQFLEQIALDLMGPQLDGLKSVKIEDPRE
jgi:Fe-S cluster biogenesis protein NfuA